jgi:hypothetical protein
MTNNKELTAVDKAKELIEKFEQLINYTSQASRICESTAKQCALIQVDGILMAIQDLPIDNTIWDYWQQIKLEIQTYGGGEQ